jgi:hypothetical protein
MAPPTFQAHSESAQTCTSGIWTSLNLEVESFDNYGGHSILTNTSRYTAQVAGVYLVSGSASFKGSSGGNTLHNRGVRIQVNGTSSAHGSFVKTLSADGTASSAVNTTCLVYLNVGDYVEVQGLQDSGSDVVTSATAGDVAPQMSVLWVSN